MTPTKTAEITEERVVPARIPLPGDAEDALIDEACRVLRLPAFRERFVIFTEREERKATAVASNAPFSEWDKTFTDPRLCAAIADRLTFKATLIQTGTNAYRLKAAETEHHIAGRS